MLVALLLAAGSALLGGALALLARRRRGLLELTRTFAFAAAAGVVGFHLLPEVLPELGVRALIFMAGGFTLPWLLEAGTRRLAPAALGDRGRVSHLVAAEIGFAALAFHSLVEGLTLWAALQAPSSHLDLEVAIVAHHAPLTAAVALPFLELGGTRKTAVRVAGIAVAGAAGVLMGSLLPGLSAQPLEKLLLPAMAATAGALLHVAFDEIEAQAFASRWERAADLLACAAGLGIAAGSALWKSHDPQQAAILRQWFGSLLVLATGAAPCLLLGTAALFALRLWGVAARAPARMVRSLQPDALLLTLALLGPVALLVRALGGVALSAALGQPAHPREDCLRERAPWVLLALGLAAALAFLIVPDGLSPLVPAAAATLLALVIAANEPAAATPLAAVLVARGAPPSALVAALAVGSALAAGLRLDARVAGAVVAAGAACAAAIHFLGTGAPLAPLAISFTARVIGGAALVLWLLLVLGAVWRAGARGFFAPLRHGHQH